MLQGAGSEVVAVGVGHAPAALLWALQCLTRASPRAVTFASDYHRRMTQGARSKVLVVAAPHAPANPVLGAQAPNARGAANVHALAFVPVPLAPACKQVYAMRGPLSRCHSWRKGRCGTPAWLALARAASVNRSIHTDTQVHRAAKRRLFMAAGDFRR